MGPMYCEIFYILLLGQTTCAFSSQPSGGEDAESWSLKETSATVYSRESVHTDYIAKSPRRVLDIRFEIRYPLDKCCLILFFAPNDIHRHALKQCYVGQTIVENDTRFNHRFIFLKPGTHNSGCEVQDSTIVCNNNRSLQSNDPIRGHYMLGYLCEEIQILNATISIFVESTNEVQGETLLDPTCKKYYEKTTFPNYVGHTLQDEATTLFRLFRVIFLEANCYHHLEQFLCRIFFFEYKNESIFPPCRLQCKEFKKACGTIMQKYSIPFGCTYFPNVTNPEVCFNKPVDCGLPKELDYMTINYKNTTFGFQAHYKCFPDFFQVGNISKSTCQYSGKWSNVSVKCLPVQKDLLYGTLLNIEIVFLDAIMLISIVTSGVFIAWNRMEILLIYYISVHRYFKRECVSMAQQSKIYNAFISYASSELTEIFVMTTMTDHLEKSSAQLRLFLHHRDCLIGKLIIENILQAMHQSKNAVILLNQDYIDRKWCIFEFAQIHKRHMTDSSFCIIIVLMEPLKKLHRVPHIIQAYLTATTYIPLDDSKIWSRLTHAIMK